MPKFRITFLILTLSLAVLIAACQSKAKDTVSTPETKSPQVNVISAVGTDPKTEGAFTKISEFKNDMDTDTVQEIIALYTSAGKDDKGNIMWDDGQKWLLVVEDGKEFYPLLSQYVQLGSVYFNVAGGVEDVIPKVTVIISTGSGIKIVDYTFDKGKKGYSEEYVYDSKALNVIYSSIPNYK